MVQTGYRSSRSKHMPEQKDELCSAQSRQRTLGGTSKLLSKDGNIIAMGKQLMINDKKNVLSVEISGLVLFCVLHNMLP